MNGKDQNFSDSILLNFSTQTLMIIVVTSISKKGSLKSHTTRCCKPAGEHGGNEKRLSILIMVMFTCCNAFASETHYPERSYRHSCSDPHYLLFFFSISTLISVFRCCCLVSYKLQPFCLRLLLIS